MAIINRQEKWIYLGQPHTASRATSDALLKLDGCETIGHHHSSLLDLTKPDKDKTIEPQPLETYLDYNVICTVRNPLDVIVTHYWSSRNSRREPWLTFDQWVRSVLYTPPIAFPLYRELWMHANTFVYYEHLQSDLNYVLDRNVPLEKNPQHVTRHKEHWLTYYSEELLDMVLMFQQPFMNLFGYNIEEDGTVWIDDEVRDKLSSPITRLRGGKNGRTV